MPAPEQVVEAAVRQIEQGFAVFALAAGAKVPVTEHGFKNATTRPEWARAQLSAQPAGNYGITWPVDAPERVVVFDLDDGGGAARPWQDRVLDLIARLGPLPPTKATTTPSGGRHAFYRWPADVPVPAGDELFGFTVRWPGRGYLVGPGSVVDGRPYEEGPVSAIAALPDAWVQAAIAERPARRNGTVAGGDALITIAPGGFELPERIPSGRRYATVRDYVASRYNAGLGLEELWDLVRTQVAPRFDVAKTEQELRADFDRVTSKLVERLGPPAAAGRQIDAAAAVAAVTELTDAPLTDFDSRPIEWLWPAWLPLGVVTVMDGNPGVSKSTLVADLAARISRGSDWPDGSPGTGRPGRTIWVTTEDDPGRVLRPRVEAAGGDPALVRFVTSEVVLPDVAAAFTELLVRRAEEPLGLALAVLDPLFSHVGAKVRTISDSEMRSQVMRPLSEAAEAANVAILVVRHFSKDVKATAINRGAGSLGGIVGAARSLWTAMVDPEDDEGNAKLVGVSKSNYARIPRARRYQVVDRLPPGWVTGSVPGVMWVGEAEDTIDGVIAAGPDSTSATEALNELLEPGPLAAETVFKRMQSKGFGRHATRTAQRRLGVLTKPAGFGGEWRWRLPESAESQAPDSLDDPDSLASGARAGRDSSPHSLDSLGDGPESADRPENQGRSVRARASAREAEPTPITVDAASTERVRCHFYADHQSKHFRAPDGWRCEICSPLEETAQ